MAYPPSPIDADKNDGIDADTGAQDGPTTVGDHAGHHNALASGLNDVVTELGPNPSGSEATVQARIAAEETARAAADTALDGRLDAIEGLGSLATDAELTAGLAGKANSNHTHAIADVTALQTALDAKQDASTAATDAELSSHTSQTTGAHGGIVASSDPRLSDARTPTAHKTSHATGGSDALAPGDIGAAAATHGHAQSDITGLATALAGKQDLVQVVNQGSLGASYTLSTAGKPVTWLTGTLNANHVLTVSGLVAGAQVVLFVTQDATGGRTLTVSDGTNSSAVPVALAASAFTILRLFSTNGTDIEVDLGPEQEVTQSELDAEAAARAAGDALAVPKALADAKGDLFVATADGVVSRLPVGSNDEVLTADSAQTAGVKWAAAAGGSSGGGVGMPRTRLQPPSAASANFASTGGANRAIYMRSLEQGSISQILLEVGTSSGNISVAVCTGGSKRSNPNTRVATTGAIPCPAAGVNVVSLGSTVTMGPDHWFAISMDNTSATVRSESAASFGITQGALGFGAYADGHHPIPASPSPTAGWPPALFLVGV